MEAHATVPGHVTGFFSVHQASQPAKAGSRGAGIALQDGVTVSAKETPLEKVKLNGREATIEPVEYVLERFDSTVTVEIETQLPIGSGFGVSGAAALGTALTAATVTEEYQSEQELVRLSHVAEVKARTGLGDVVAQARGGVPVRIEPGATGMLDGIPATQRLEYITLGNLSTAEILTGDTTTLSQAGENALDRLLDSPTIEELFECSQEFAREADLYTPTVQEAIEAVHENGGTAMMSMLGQTVIALDRGLSNAGYDPAVTKIDHSGARLTQKSDDL
ncbi:sugar kinase [Salinarchaeum sp. IM2453]|uniref:pantoate kinase n=1 Tax=Salinarchaeum sp. IM2453 TaxID=2862870 RepID=UPI001C83AD2B|nr:pantoate kinase [Salinarchaeum sp. IM2453]QZA89162.1 sugar kinase [Salinarchaeum sp. IM2453]